MEKKKISEQLGNQKLYQEIGGFSIVNIKLNTITQHHMIINTNMKKIGFYLYLLLLNINNLIDLFKISIIKKKIK